MHLSFCQLVIHSKFTKPFMSVPHILLCQVFGQSTGPAYAIWACTLSLRKVLNHPCSFATEHFNWQHFKLNEPHLAVAARQAPPDLTTRLIQLGKGVIAYPGNNMIDLNFSCLKFKFFMNQHPLLYIFGLILEERTVCY